MYSPSFENFGVVPDIVVIGKGFGGGIFPLAAVIARESLDVAAETVMYAALSRGLSFKLTMGNIITLTPPLTITTAEMARALDIIEECIADIA